MEQGTKRKGLGRGLEALIPVSGDFLGSRSRQAEVVAVPIAKIQPNPYQPRRHFSSERLRELADSIRQYGLLQPIVVAERDGGYELIAGERRLRAAQLAGLSTVPAVIRSADPRTSLAFALIENLQREDLNPIEEALAYRRLQAEFGLTQAEIAEQVGKSRSTVANSMRLLQLPQEIQEALAQGRLSAGHARAILAIDDAEEQKRFAYTLLQESTSVRAAERLARRESGKRTPRHPDWDAAEEALRRTLGLKVQLRVRADGSGKLEIEYPSVDVLNQLLDRLGVRV